VGCRELRVPSRPVRDGSAEALRSWMADAKRIAGTSITNIDRSIHEGADRSHIPDRHVRLLVRNVHDVAKTPR
jgi:hypothetical protein